ncbi:DUF6089 family protein [Runella sp. SP2]|uniref:DUF6089 family protein n=1 Tax=Runella sp. SP2 TaxID=2268026 RepID=UPI000F08E0BA|nr:DUF6089 family protein [Runella sp. SP2]AYQ36085.1 hypothetical protein DTQ70_29780 [Runella sp. SP2]
MTRLLGSFVISALLLLSARAAFCQSMHRWEVGIGTGTVGYLGDLNRHDLWPREFRPSVNLYARKYIGDVVALRYNVQGGQFWGRDKHYPTRLSRNLTLETNFVENSLLLEWDFYNMNPIFYRQQNGFQSFFSPYFFSGISVVYAKPQINFDESQTPYTWIREGIAIDRAANYSAFHLSFPVGLGIKYDVSPEWIVGLEASFRLSTSDYLDGVSYAGNAKKNDAYQVATFNITRRLGLYKMRIRRRW